MPDEILHLSEESKHQGLPSLAYLQSEARTADLSVTLLIQAGEASAGQENARRRHDIAAALRTLRLTVDALKEGYRFDDSAATAKIRAIDKAVAILGREGDLWRQLLPTK